MNESEMVSWMAGFFDGEGCVSISRSRRTKKGDTKNPDDFWYCYTLQVAVSQKQEAPLKRFHEMFGGHLFSYKAQGATYYRWQLWSNGALEFLKKLLPYLLVKRGIAELGVRFQEQMTLWNKEFGRRGYPEFVIKGREDFYLQGRELNMRNRANNREIKYEGPQYEKFHTKGLT